MALTRIKSSNIADETVVAADIADGSVTDAKIQTGVSSSKLTGNLPALNGSALTNLTAANISGALPAIDGSNLTGVSTDTTVLENNIAILAFKTQASNNLAKFNLIDQVIDEYYDTSGIDASASTNETLNGSGVAKYYEGTTGGTPTVTGGTITTDGDYTIHTFTSNGNYVTNMAQAVDWLVVAGGGAGGGPDYSGGGGAGGLRTSYGSTSGGGASAESQASFSAATYTITVGAGGTSAATYTNGTSAQQGKDSSIVGTGVNLVSAGGGRANYNQDGSAGGSGGGGGREGGAGNADGGAGTANQGYAGGSSDPSDGGAGGGGASAVGENAPTDNSRAGNGGAGLSVSISGSAVTYAGGGGGAAHSGSHGTGGTGGGGAGTNTGTGHGTANTGGGGGGTKTGGNTGTAGGSGIVVIRRSTASVNLGADLTLQSVANTALSAPTTGDVVMLIENAQGTATLNTDIKAWVSRNGGTGWDQATLVDKGTWGSGTKKIVSANNVAFSNSASGTDMRYKITTHNQSAGSKETRVHATSLAWA